MSEHKVGNFAREDFERHVRTCLPAACLYVFDALLDTAFSAEARVQRLEEAIRLALQQAANESKGLTVKIPPHIGTLCAALAAPDTAGGERQDSPCPRPLPAV